MDNSNRAEGLSEPDERGIDLAIMAFFGAKMSGETDEVASQRAEALLTFFGFEPEPCAQTPEGNDHG